VTLKILDATYTVDVALAIAYKNGVDAYLAFVKARARAFVSLMRGGIGSDPEVAQIVEDDYGVQLKGEDMEGVKTVRQAVDLVMSKLG